MKRRRSSQRRLSHNPAEGGEAEALGGCEPPTLQAPKHINELPTELLLAVGVAAVGLREQ